MALSSRFFAVLAAAALALAVQAPSVHAQALVGLVAPGTGATDVFPTTAWAQTPYELNPPVFPDDDDWVLAGAAVELGVTVPAGLTLGACDVDVTWRAGTFAFASFDADATLFASSAAFALPGGSGVRLNVARLGDNATTGAGARLGLLRLTLGGADTVTVRVAVVQCRAFDGAGGQAAVAASPGAPARVGALAGDLAARTGAATRDDTRGDGIVDFADLQALSAAYGASSTPGHPRHALYRLKFDLAGHGGSPGPDGIVDFADLQALSAVYGKSAF